MKKVPTFKYFIWYMRVMKIPIYKNLKIPYSELMKIFINKPN